MTNAAAVVGLAFVLAERGVVVVFRLVLIFFERALAVVPAVLVLVAAVFDLAFVLVERVVAVVFRLVLIAAGRVLAAFALPSSVPAHWSACSFPPMTW